MEIIKRKVNIVTVTATTTGCTGNCYMIIPYSGTGVTYSTNILLTANATDWGFFDVLDDPNATNATGATISAITYVVSGTTNNSRLNELRKFSKNGTLSQLYFTSTGSSVSGLDTGLTTTGLTASTYVYYISGITYTDFISTGETATTYLFTSSGLSSPVFINLPIIKDERKQNIISSPIIKNNVFIVRDENNVFQNNYRLRNIQNLTQLEYYGGGAYFNIVNNI